MPKGLEIEKKYLIIYPDVEKLKERGAVEKKMVQIYLTAEKGVSERVRKTEINGEVVYTHTIKRKLEGIVRQEDEKVVSKEEYEALSLRADSACRPIEKVRWALKENGFTYEFDLFPFWTDRAFLEIELESPDAEVILPDYVTVLADVSEDKNYTNHALARKK